MGRLFALAFLSGETWIEHSVKSQVPHVSVYFSSMISFTLPSTFIFIALGPGYTMLIYATKRFSHIKMFVEAVQFDDASGFFVYTICFNRLMTRQALPNQKQKRYKWIIIIEFDRRFVAHSN